ncbi:MAG: hypothetical protein P8X97_06745 [Candidatus Bathyarchaeota archaeon]|jgi:transcription elongation factor Elf1
MQQQKCRICDSHLEVEQTCKFCNEPTKLFCHNCGLPTEKYKHPACMVLDVNSIILASYMQK